MIFKPQINLQIDSLFIRIQNNINSDTVAFFEKTLLQCCKVKQKILPVIIDSNGGCAYALVALSEMMKNSKINIATIVESRALSCAAILLSCGHQGFRYMAKNATVMVHDIKTTYNGKTEDVKADAQETDRLNQLMYKVLGDNCKKDNDFFKKIMQKNNCADLYLSADDCLKFGMIDFIGVPRFETKIKYKLSL
jgi:ATP-dependent Clp protease protease subunit